MQRLYVDNANDLAALCARLDSARHLALDTEFLREKTYYPKLCLLQVCDGEVAACIDPLSIEDLSPLLALLERPSCVKVWHAARQDLEIFLHRWNLLPGPVFDTQMAAAVLGVGDQVGYARLVQDQLGVELPKDQSRSDWCARPLQEIQLSYAFDDVVHLDRLYRRMTAQLEETGRTHWLDEDFAQLLDPATYRTEPDEAWLRIKGRQVLKGARLAVLQQLAAWREQQAIARDRPRRWVLKDEVMVDIARRNPGDLQGLSRIRGIDESVVRRDGEALLDCVQRGLAIPREQWPRERIPPRLKPDQEVAVELLAAVVHLVAERNSIMPAALATRADLARLVGGEDSQVMHGWRKALVGEPLAAVLAGEMTMRLRDGRPVLEPC